MNSQNFLSNLALTKSETMVTGDINIHVDVEMDSLSSCFKSILDSLGFLQVVNTPTHKQNHALDLMLTYGLSLWQ